jgi:hypothetical protein
MSKETFDPWTATADQRKVVARLAEEELRRVGFLARNHAGAKLVAWAFVVDLADDPDTTGGDILWAVETCLAAEIACPEWLYQAYSDRLYQVTLRGASWQEAFGPERPKYFRNPDPAQNAMIMRLHIEIEQNGLPPFTGSYLEKLEALLKKLEIPIPPTTAAKLLTRWKKNMAKLPTF